jgi:hypothetical protein
MGDDVGFPPAWTIVRELKRRMAPIPISVSIPEEEFLRGLKDRRLPGGVLYLTSAESVDAANRTMEQVFAYQPVD